MLTHLYTRHFYVVLSLVVTAPLLSQHDWEDTTLASQFDSLLLLAASLPNDSLASKSLALHEAGKVADSADDFPAAISATQRALELRLQNEQLAGDGVLLSAMNLGLYYNKLGQYRQALDYFGIIINRSPNRKEGEAWFQIARSYGLTGEFVAGEKAFSRAAQLSPFIDSPYLSAYLQQQIGVLHLSKNNASGGTAAIGPLTKALEYFISDEDLVGEMLTRNYLGWALSDAGNYAAAIKELEKSLQLAPAADAYDEDYAAIYSNLGIAHRRQGNTEQALANYRKALGIQLTSAEDLANSDEIYSGLSTAFRTSGLVDSAIHYALRALVTVIPNFDPKAYDGLPEIAMIDQHRPAVLTYLTDLALALSAAEDYPAALRAFRRADELLDTMRLRQLLDDTRHYWRADARNLYDQAIATARQADDAAALFHFLEKARSRLLLDELSASRAAELLPPTVRKQLENSTRMVRLNPEDPALTDQFRQLQDSILQAFPNYAQQRIGSPPPPLSDLPEILGNRQLVEYYVSNQQTLALTYTKAKGLNITQLAPPAVWEPILREYRQQITDPTNVLDATVALGLYEALVAPLDLDPTADLVVIPDDALYLLPFGALISARPSPGSSWQQWPWLAREYEIGYAFSAQLLDRARWQNGRGNGRTLAVAPVARIASGSQIDARLELPATLRTVRQLATLFPTDTLINEAATKHAFQQGADAYSLLHLGTHASLEGAGSFLLRGDSSNRYTSNDLLAHQLRADLVVIGACETGLGEQLIGEGVASLGRGFARRGASGLIMSLWSIDDAATADLLHETYTSLAAGQGPATALRTAGDTFRNNTNPRFGHPYFWAGLVHYGRNEPLPFLVKPNWTIQIVFGLLTIVGLLYFLARRRSTRQ